MLPFSMRLLFILRCTLFTKRRRTTTTTKSIPLPFIKLIETFLFFFFVRSNGSNFHPSAHSLSAYWWIQAKYKSVGICFFSSLVHYFVWKSEFWIHVGCIICYHHSSQPNQCMCVCVLICLNRIYFTYFLIFGVLYIDTKRLNTQPNVQRYIFRLRQKKNIDR